MSNEIINSHGVLVSKDFTHNGVTFTVTDTCHTPILRKGDYIWRCGEREYTQFKSDDKFTDEVLRPLWDSKKTYRYDGITGTFSYEDESIDFVLLQNENFGVCDDTTILAWTEAGKYDINVLRDAVLDFIPVWRANCLVTPEVYPREGEMDIRQVLFA